MKTLKITAIVVLAIIIILGIVIAMQPPEAHIEKSIVIKAPVTSIFPEVSNYRNFIVWSPWTKMDPKVKQTFEGGEGVVGSKVNWDGPKTGKGSQWIEEIEENKRVKNGMSFGDSADKFYNEFIFMPEKEGTRVTWMYNGPNNGLGGKLMWVIMGTMLSSQFEQGLKDLKELVESKHDR